MWIWWIAAWLYPSEVWYDFFMHVFPLTLMNLGFVAMLSLKPETFPHLPLKKRQKSGIVIVLALSVILVLILLDTMILLNSMMVAILWNTIAAVTVYCGHYYSMGRQSFRMSGSSED